MFRHILLLLVNCAAITSQAQYTYIRQITSAEGLPSNTVNDMLQDDEGFMWFATDEGVSRFDGHRFYNYRKSDGIADDEVIRLGKDHEGRIWFLGFNGKASFFLHGKFYNENNSALAAQTQLGSALVKFMVSKKGTVYLISNTDGFLQVDGNTVKKYSKDTLLKNGDFHFINGLRCVKLDTAGMVWLLDRDSIYIFKDGNPRTKVMSQQQFPENMLNSFLLSDGSYVIPNNNNLIRYHDGKTDTVKGLAIQVQNDYVSIEEDNYGNIWAMTKSGAYLFRNKNFNALPDKLFDGTYCGHIYTDNEGNTWLSPLRNGVFFIPSLDVQFMNTSSGLANNNVLVIADHPEGVITGFSNGSVQVISNDGHAFAIQPPVSIGSYMLDIYPEKENEWMMLTTAEVVHCDKNLKAKSNTVINWAKSYERLEDGSMLIGGGFRLSLFKNEKLSELYTFPFENRIYTIAKDRAQNIWLGTEEGLYCFRDSVMQFFGDRFPLLKYRINDLKMDSAGQIWVASSQYGILLFHGDSVRNLLPADEKISGRKIFIGPDGTVYAGTDKGIFILKGDNAGKFQISRIRKSDGLPSEKINTLLLKQGMLWIGTDEGLEIFPVNKKTSQLLSVPIRLTSFTVNDTLFSTDSIASFNYLQNNIHLSFAGISFREASSVSYRYRIRLEDTVWKYTSNSSLDLPELPPGKYNITVQAATTGNNWSQTPLQLAFTVQSPYWQKPWFYGTVSMALLVAGIFLFRFRYKLKLQKEEQKRKSVETELAALRSQMNPHFIFNSLNAIQDFIFQHKTEEANEYLTEFAKLIRAILNQSRKQYASIEEECELLQMYLGLESLRFNHSFEWEIRTGNEIVASEIMIPSMLLQPVVENSIKHGFKNARRKGMLKIGFEKENGFIRCEVEDNGLGRNGEKHNGNSLALSISQERLTILNQSLNQPCTMEVIDLFEEGVPSGLKTVFRFPAPVSNQ